MNIVQIYVCEKWASIHPRFWSWWCGDGERIRWGVEGRKILGRCGGKVYCAVIYDGDRVVIIVEVGRGGGGRESGV